MTKNWYQFNYTITSTLCSVSLFFIWWQKTGCFHYYCTQKTIYFINQRQKVLTTSLSTIWENTDVCAKQYTCDSALYLTSVMSQCYSIIFDRGISAPGHGKEVVDGLNYVYKRYIYQLMSTVKLPGSNIFDSQIQIHTGTPKYDASLAKEFQKNLTKNHRKDGIIDQGKHKNYSWKENGQTDSIMFRIMMLLKTNMWKFIVTQLNHQNYHFVAHIKNLMAQRGWVSIIICVWSKTKYGYMCNSPYTICLCCMYINSRQTLDIWYTTIWTRAL